MVEVWMYLFLVFFLLFCYCEVYEKKLFCYDQRKLYYYLRLSWTFFFGAVFILNCTIYELTFGRIFKSPGYVVNLNSSVSNSCTPSENVLIAQSKPKTLKERQAERRSILKGAEVGAPLLFKSKSGSGSAVPLTWSGANLYCQQFHLLISLSTLFCKYLCSWGRYYNH